MSARGWPVVGGGCVHWLGLVQTAYVSTQALVELPDLAVKHLGGGGRRCRVLLGWDGSVLLTNRASNYKEEEFTFGEGI
jgi:hypothetical protein